MQLSCAHPYNARRMAQSEDPRKNADEAETKPNPHRDCAVASDSMVCERCGKAEMYRMHAVWRCPECGFKTDCCGW
jgi:ribosomal protein L37AE/L43A